MNIFDKLVVSQGFGKLREITDEQSSCFHLIHDELERSSIILYRGTDKRSLLSKFEGFEEFSLTEEAEKLFYFGEKAKYASEVGLKFSHCLGTVELQELVELTGFTSTVFERSKNGYESFDLGNQEFSDFFSDKDKAIGHIRDSFESLTHEQKLAVRNMLISFLHTHCENMYKNESMLLSTSKNYPIASEHAGINGVVCVYWIPEHLKKFSINSNSDVQYGQLLEGTLIPCIDTPLHIEEYETSVLGALLPKYLLGYYDKSRKHFVVNHHLFKSGVDRSLQNLVVNGCDLDQSDFDTRVGAETTFARSIEVSTDKIQSELVQR
ncbi:hypothetical protein [Vibrio parahaemolyticus]|uniref:hypothetical protein n=1 Tax=Vibrio parahaemolyticus TaxID=670 RepID=UPI00193DE368|nr:hypothetical protein [Vibrio parahaemolyticus]EHH1223575.1 hypothetical protein [Vibrio parahaemolyticus]EIY8174563.1 hypothetical protein [Vibrio parahaemolyticus]EIY8252273.1 hypothetical protein [Vibrio parahaemolyticus]ELA8142787.1 hypothetical protein [Vibrio parahaemolyticus]MBM4896444.1 hypothetical protein [Vibrio parahaemolyticus]